MRGRRTTALAWATTTTSRSHQGKDKSWSEWEEAAYFIW
jgi:hypothetical protein